MVENQEKNIQTRIAIVTGGARGIGASIVTMLASNGFNVVLNYNTSFEKANNLASLYSNIYPFKADVSKRNEVKNLIKNK